MFICILYIGMYNIVLLNIASISIMVCKSLKCMCVRGQYVVSTTTIQFMTLSPVYATTCFAEQIINYYVPYSISREYLIPTAEKKKLMELVYKECVIVYMCLLWFSIFYYTFFFTLFVYSRKKYKLSKAFGNEAFFFYIYTNNYMISY